jgi:hypothetical protein
MFSLFKKPSVKKTLEKSEVMWSVLSQRDRESSLKNILIFCTDIANSCKTKKEVFFKIAEIRYGLIREYKIKNDYHPIIMQINIISDYFYSYWNEKDLFDRANNLMTKVDSLAGHDDGLSALRHLLEQISRLR